jgi:hypothetical protein
MPVAGREARGINPVISLLLMVTIPLAALVVPFERTPRDGFCTKLHKGLRR